MQVEQAIASAIMAMHDLAAVAAPHAGQPLVAFSTEFPAAETQEANRVFNLGGQSLRFTAEGRTSTADSAALRRYSSECAHLAKVHPGYPQPAFVTFRLHVSL